MLSKLSKLPKDEHLEHLDPLPINRGLSIAQEMEGVQDSHVTVDEHIAPDGTVPDHPLR
jgi:hypothetical protein